VPDKPLILIVEDETDVARYLTAALEDEGFEVLAAANAEDGLELAERRPPDLVCLDLVMPGPSGLTFYREMLACKALRSTPIVVVTGLTRADARERLGLGDTLPEPAAYIEKPVDLPALVKSIREILGAQRK
jgi:DNA-binding response OmpR family regulator